MTNNTNMELFGRFRQIGRRMRMGWVPDDLISADEETRARRGESRGRTCVRLYKRELILSILAFNGTGMKQRDIAEEMGVSPSTISEMVNRLVEDGYVDRTDDSEDRRVKFLVLTGSGRRQAEKILTERMYILEYIFQNLNETDKRELIVLLDRMLGRTD